MKTAETCALVQGTVMLACSIILIVAWSSAAAQRDPGPRPDKAAGGGPYRELNSAEQNLFYQALSRFQEVNSVSGTIPGEESQGLGPTFNGNSCAQCHAQPAVGGSSPGLSSPQNPVPNPQVALATLDGATNTVPSFIKVDGPVREVRFVRASHNQLDGAVHGLYTIRGRVDAPGCNLAQPDFASQLENSNLAFRIPTQLFGLGLVEYTPDATLLANLASNSSAKARLGIEGHFNLSGNDNTLTRFGWKAQNKSLLLFSGEAYNVEQGVTNELFPNERSAVEGCVFNPTPEDFTAPGTTGSLSPVSSDMTNFAIFVRLSEPATPMALSASGQSGAKLFDDIGCALCHTPSLTTGGSPFTGMSNTTYHPYSDFALHRMGAKLADGIVQGAAGPDEFRTAPLWGLGQRLFFLHDGRTSDLLQAIRAHSSSGSEANAVIAIFNGLTPQQQQNVLDFLRAL